MERGRRVAVGEQGFLQRPFVFAKGFGHVRADAI